MRAHGRGRQEAARASACARSRSSEAFAAPISQSAIRPRLSSSFWGAAAAFCSSFGPAVFPADVGRPGAEA